LKPVAAAFGCARAGTLHFLASIPNATFRNTTRDNAKPGNPSPGPRLQGGGQDPQLRRHRKSAAPTINALRRSGAMRLASNYLK
jgi:hypothetical protein